MFGMWPSLTPKGCVGLMKAREFASYCNAPSKLPRRDRFVKKLLGHYPVRLEDGGTTCSRGNFPCLVSSSWYSHAQGPVHGAIRITFPL